MPCSTRPWSLRRPARVPAALFALAWLAVSGCGESPEPIGPDSGTELDATTTGIGPDASAAVQPDQASPFMSSAAADLIDFSGHRVLRFLVPPSLTEPRSRSKLISAATGGFVKLNGFRVDIPAGALAEDTVITLDLPTTLPEATYVVADFGPHGLTFSKPVKLTFSLSGVNLEDINLSTVKIWYWNGSRWRDSRGSIKNGSVVRRTSHFSKYGARGIDTTSGG